MEATKLKRGNLQELAQVLEKLLQGRTFTYTTKERRHYKEPWGELETYPQCTLYENEAIRHWISNPDMPDERHTQSAICIAITIPGEKYPKTIYANPCVRFGGQLYDKNGQTTEYKIHRDRIELDIENSTSFHTFQIS